MNPQVLAMTILLTVLPVSELRGGIPYALAHGADPFLTYFICVLANSLIAPLVFVFLNTIHKVMYGINSYKRFFDSIVQRSRSKVHEKVEKYGYLGLALFVAVPLPVTGAYTGVLGAWIIGMEIKRSIIAITAGVFISGAIVSVISYFGIKAFSFLAG